MTLARKTPLKPGKPLMRKTALKAGAATLKRSGPMKAIGARAKRMRQGKVAASQIEAAWMDAAQAFGCVVCWLHYQAKATAEIHHLKDGDRRRGHLFTLPLCVPHHRGGAGEGLFISRHPWKSRFEAAYGTEDELLQQLRFALAAQGITVPLLVVDTTL